MSELTLIYSDKMMNIQESIMMKMQNCKVFMSAFIEIEGQEGHNVVRLKKEYQHLAEQLKKIL